MPKITVKFERIIQDSQEYGSDQEHMVSRVFFTIAVDGRRLAASYADVKQSVGAGYDSGPLEVGAPKDYVGPWNHLEFARAVERYIRGLLGGAGRAIRFGPGARGIRMHDNTIVSPHETSFDAESAGAPGW